MPLKDTPWGSMRQARSAQHTSGNVPRPPRPSYLPPTPPKCSVSPLPSTVSSIGKSEITSVVYESQKNNLKNGHNHTTTTTPARFAHLRPSSLALPPDGVSSRVTESNNNSCSSTNNHDTSEESESEDLDDYEVSSDGPVFKIEFGFSVVLERRLIHDGH